MSGRRSFCLRILCFELTKQALGTKGSLDISWDIKFMPERFIPFVTAILAPSAYWQIEDSTINSLAALRSWPILTPVLFSLQVLVPIMVIWHLHGNRGR